jgi:hypothetical protein
MAPQRVSDAATHAFGDDVSVVDLPTFRKGGKRHNRGVDTAVRTDGPKRQKLSSSKNAKSDDAAGGNEKASALSEKAVEGAKGKSRFYHEYVHSIEPGDGRWAAVGFRSLGPGFETWR